MDGQARFLSGSGGRQVTFSLDTRQLTLLICVCVALAVVLFAGGVVVGRWYGAAAVKPLPGLAALDKELEQKDPEPPDLSFHAKLAGPPEASPPPKQPALAPAEEETDDTDLPDLPEDQDPLPPKKEPKAPPREAPSEKEAREAPSNASEKGRFTLQLKSFPSKKEAEALLGKLKAAGEAPYLVHSEVSGMYLVRVGAFETIEEAKKAQKSLSARVGLRSVISSR